MAVRRLERSAVGIDRGRVAELQQLHRLAPVERDTHVDVGRVGREDVVLAQRRGAVAALDPDDAAHRPRLQQPHNHALELAELVIVSSDAVTPRVARVVDHDCMLRGRVGEVDPARLVHERRDPAARPVELQAQMLVFEMRVGAGDRVAVDRAEPDPVGAVAERRDDDREGEAAPQAAHRGQRPGQLHRHGRALVVDDVMALFARPRVLDLDVRPQLPRMRVENDDGTHLHFLLDRDLACDRLRRGIEGTGSE